MISSAERFISSTRNRATKRVWILVSPNIFYFYYLNILHQLIALTLSSVCIRWKKKYVAIHKCRVNHSFANVFFQRSVTKVINFMIYILWFLLNYDTGWWFMFKTVALLNTRKIIFVFTKKHERKKTIFRVFNYAQYCKFDYL